MILADGNRLFEITGLGPLLRQKHRIFRHVGVAFTDLPAAPIGLLPEGFRRELLENLYRLNVFIPRFQIFVPDEQVVGLRHQFCGTLLILLFALINPGERFPRAAGELRSLLRLSRRRHDNAEREEQTKHLHLLSANHIFKPPALIFTD